MGLETVELVVSWENAFAIAIPNSVAATLITPEAAAAAIERLLINEGRFLARSEIDHVIMQTTLEISGMKEMDYRVDGRFVQDFGLD